MPVCWRQRLVAQASVSRKLGWLRVSWAQMLKVTVQQAVAENGIECPHSKKEGKRVCVFLKPGFRGDCVSAGPG